MPCQIGSGATRSSFSNALTRAIVSSGCMTPEGLVYRPELLSEDEERALLDELERLDFHEIRMHGVLAKRTARHFGVEYDYDARAAVQEAEPIPEWLVPGRERAAELAGVG